MGDATWVPNIPIPTDPDGWHPLDALYAPLYSPSRELVGILSVDLPPDGRRPDHTVRSLLEMFAAQAGIAINNARLSESLETERQRLHASEESFRLAFDAAGIGMALVSLDPVEPLRHLRVERRPRRPVRLHPRAAPCRLRSGMLCSRSIVSSASRTRSEALEVRCARTPSSYAPTARPCGSASPPRSSRPRASTGSARSSRSRTSPRARSRSPSCPGRRCRTYSPGCPTGRPCGRGWPRRSRAAERRGASVRCCSATSTTSRPSTTASATPPVTRRSSSPRRGSSASCATATSSGASAATSSSSSSRTPRAGRHRRWPGASPAPSASRSTTPAVRSASTSASASPSSPPTASTSTRCSRPPTRRCTASRPAARRPTTART